MKRTNNGTLSGGFSSPAGPELLSPVVRRRRGEITYTRRQGIVSQAQGQEPEQCLPVHGLSGKPDHPGFACANPTLFSVSALRSFHSIGSDLECMENLSPDALRCTHQAETHNCLIWIDSSRSLFSCLLMHVQEAHLR
jgi:hypothetical protein